MIDHAEGHDPEVLEAAPSQSVFNPFRTVWRHKYLLALGIVAGCMVGALYYARAKPIYQSTAQVLVVQKTPESLPLSAPDARSAMTEDYLSTHQTLIRSPTIVADAVRRSNLAGLPSFHAHADPTGEIITSLKLSREMNNGSPTSILNISYRSSEAEDASIVVNAVIRSYQWFLSARYKSVSDETAKLITEASDVLEKKLTRKQKEYQQFSLLHPTLWKGKDGISLVQERLQALETKRASLSLQETEIQGRLRAFEKAVKDGKHTRAELLSMVVQVSGTKPENDRTSAASTLEERLATLELEEKGLLADYGRDHPRVQSTRQQITVLRRYLARLGKLSALDSTGQLDPVKTHLQTLELELANTRMAAAALAELVQKEQDAAKRLRSAEMQNESYRLEIDRSQQLFDAIAKRLDEVSILKNFAGGYEAEAIAPPEVGRKVYPRPIIVFGAALMLGLLAGCGLAYLAELTDQSFRTPEEIRRRLGMPVVGHIPHFEPKEADTETEPWQLDPSLCTVNHPRSRQAEAYRGVRTALYFSTRGSGKKLIQVTSPDKGDGKSTLSSNLAVSIAQSKKKVLLIDADFRRPRIHKLFKVSGESGLASVISGEAELPDAIHDTPVPGLFVLPCGPLPPNPAELLTLTRFPEILATLRDQYDFIVVDTPPLLAVTDPLVVAPHVDALILTVRISKNARPHALRAKEILATLDAPVLGVVVNGAGGEIPGYGYDSYRYGYSYQSHYDEEDENDSYYVEDVSRTPSRKKGVLTWLLGR